MSHCAGEMQAERPTYVYACVCVCVVWCLVFENNLEVWQLAPCETCLEISELLFIQYNNDEIRRNEKEYCHIALQK